MWCKHCGKTFERGTTTSLAPYDVCNKCFKNLYTVEIVEVLNEEKIKNYEQYIEWAKEDIKEHEKEIERNNKNIKFWEEEINGLIK